MNDTPDDGDDAVPMVQFTMSTDSGAARTVLVAVNVSPPSVTFSSLSTSPTQWAAGHRSTTKIAG